MLEQKLHELAASYRARADYIKRWAKYEENRNAAEQVAWELEYAADDIERLIHENLLEDN